MGIYSGWYGFILTVFEFNTIETNKIKLKDVRSFLVLGMCTYLFSFRMFNILKLNNVKRLNYTNALQKPIIYFFHCAGTFFTIAEKFKKRIWTLK